MALQQAERDSVEPVVAELDTAQLRPCGAGPGPAWPGRSRNARTDSPSPTVAMQPITSPGTRKSESPRAPRSSSSERRSRTGSGRGRPRRLDTTLQLASGVLIEAWRGAEAAFGDTVDLV